MTCYYCLQEGIKVSDTGHCMLCKKNICTAPSQRNDKQYHGESCKCGCDALICEQHIQEHASSHGHDTVECFPNLAGLISIEAFKACFKSLSTGNTGAGLDALSVRSINRYLNLISPGRKALASKIEKITGNSFVEEFQHEDILFSPESFDEKVTGKLLELTALEAGKAWPSIDKADSLENSNQTAWFGVSNQVMGSLSEWASGGQAPTQEIITSIIPDDKLNTVKIDMHTFDNFSMAANLPSSNEIVENALKLHLEQNDISDFRLYNNDDSYKL